MNFSGTIEGGGMTMTRLIERIVHSDTPGELRLRDEASGRSATVAIRRGAVTEVAFGDLAGDAALTAITQVMPWTFEFVADEAGAMPSHPGIVARKPKARAVIRTAPVPVAETEAVRPAYIQPDLDLFLSPSHRAWIAAPDSAHCIRFAAADREFAGEVLAEDHDYFRSDFAFLRSTAENIARTLGWPAPAVFAIAEADRSTGYEVSGSGFLGAMGGAGTGVAHVIDFPPE